MGSFTPFVALLAEIEDPRRAEGKLYRLPHVVLFAILAIVSGADSYRTIHSFIDVHLAQLRNAFGVKWQRAPAYTTIRGILRQLDPTSVEAAFRRHAAALNSAATIEGHRHVAIDDKALRGSFDNFHGRRAAHLLSAFASGTALVLAHIDCDDKSNEIPAVQTLLGALGLTDAVVTVDAMHCQKKRSSRPLQAAYICSRRSKLTSPPCTTPSPRCAIPPRRSIARTPPTKSAILAMSCGWSRCSRQATAWPTPSGPVMSAPLFASLGTFLLALPRPGSGGRPARLPGSLATPSCRPPTALRQSASIGALKTAPIMCATLPSLRTQVAFAAILASSPACAHSRQTFYVSTTSATSPMHATASPSAESMLSSTCASCIER